jgi:hypothetical protein
LNAGTEDRFRWKWTADGQFSTASAYRAFFIGQHAVPGAKVLTKARAPGRCKFFIWLALHDRCWTGARRKRHNLQDKDNGTFCDQHSETISHLLSTCVLAKEVWFTVLRRCSLQRLTPTGTLQDFFDWWLSSRKQIRKEGRKAFDSLVILVEPARLPKGEADTYRTGGSNFGRGKVVVLRRFETPSSAVSLVGA